MADINMVLLSIEKYLLFYFFLHKEKLKPPRWIWCWGLWYHVKWALENAWVTTWDFLRFPPAGFNPLPWHSRSFLVCLLPLTAPQLVESTWNVALILLALYLCQTQFLQSFPRLPNICSLNTVYPSSSIPCYGLHFQHLPFPCFS